MDRSLMRLRAKAALLKQAWEESAHPRDYHGRFSGGGGGGAGGAEPSAFDIPSQYRVESAHERHERLAKDVLIAVGIVAGAVVLGEGGAVGMTIMEARMAATFA